MPTLTIEYHDANERLALEQAIAYIAQLRQLALTATVLAACEQRALTDGRAPLRSPLATALQGRVATDEQKGGAARHCPQAHPGRDKGRHPRTLLTALGPVTLQRCYFACGVCGQGEFGADRLLGGDGYVTAGACRMACLLGVQQSFQKAERALREVAGWQLDDNTIR